MTDGIKTTRRQIINESPFGMWVWQTDEGEFVADEDGNFMHVFVDGRKGDVNEAAKKALAEAARSYGIEGGRAVFWSGRRPIDDEQLAYQLSRAEAGLVPDPLDIGAIREEAQRLSSGRSD